MLVFGERVDDAVVHLELLEIGHVLPPDRIAGRLDEVHHRGRNPELEVLGGLPQPFQVREIPGAETVRERIERCEALLT